MNHRTLNSTHSLPHIAYRGKPINTLRDPLTELVNKNVLPRAKSHLEKRLEQVLNHKPRIVRCVPKIRPKSVPRPCVLIKPSINPMRPVDLLSETQPNPCPTHIRIMQRPASKSTLGMTREESLFQYKINRGDKTTFVSTQAKLNAASKRSKWRISTCELRNVKSNISVKGRRRNVLTTLGIYSGCEENFARRLYLEGDLENSQTPVTLKAPMKANYVGIIIANIAKNTHAC